MGQRKKITREMRKYFETNKNRTTYPTLWDAAKAEYIRKFIAINTCIKRKFVL